VTGQGTFYNSGNVVKSRMTITDNASNDGNAVYGSTFFFYMGPDYPNWTFLVHKATSQWTSGTHTQTLSQDYANWGSMAEGESWACAQMGFPVPDSCSPDGVYRVIDW